MSLRLLLPVLDEQKEQRLWVLLSGVVTAAIFAAGLMLFEPFWESNDDSGMSAIAHGYGNSATPSPGLIYQNVIIGGLLQHLPAVGGVLPYSWLMLGFLFCSGWALLYLAVRSGGNFWLAVIALALVFARVLAAPQYTIIAGMAAAAGALAWLSHSKAPSIGCLIAGALLITVGLLVRSREALFVLAVALPFVPWRTLSIGRAEIVAAASVLAIFAFAQFVDYQYYQTQEWMPFQAMEPLRKALTDYNAVDYILAHPDRMHALGFTKNDIRLIANYFFVDPQLADPGRLRPLLADLPGQAIIFDNVALIKDALSALYDPALLPFMLAAIGLSLLSRCWLAAVVSWCIFLAVIVTFALLGRPGVLHIYYPIPVLLLFSGIGCGLWTETRGGLIGAIPYSILTVALAGALWFNIRENQSFIADSRLVQDDIASLDRSSQPVVWGAAFPYELALQVLARDIDAGSFRHYSLGWESLAPYLMDNFKGLPWKNLPDRLARDRDIPFIADSWQINLLATYCREHLGKELAVRERQMHSFAVFYVTCERG